MKKLLLRLTSGIVVRLGMAALVRKRKLKERLGTILCLHRVSDESSVSWPPLPIRVFERLCEHWASHYHSTHVSSLKEEKDTDKPLLILSFDDGFQDFYENAWPILKRYGIKANMNIVTSSASTGREIWTQRVNNALDMLWKTGIGETILLPNGSSIKKDSSLKQLNTEIQKLFQYLYAIEQSQRQSIIDTFIKDLGIREIQTPVMNWDQIIELSEEGVEIGSHTATHDVLPTITDVSKLRSELTDSKSALEDRLKKEVEILALPNGFSNEEVNRIAFESGYEFLLTVNDRLLPLKFLNDRTVLPRVLIHHTGYYENILGTENFFSTSR